MTMEQFEELKPGDIVLLNSGSEPMTVKDDKQMGSIGSVDDKGRGNSEI